MAIDLRLGQRVVVFCWVILAGTAYAAEEELNLALPAHSFSISAPKSIMLAANDAGVYSANAGGSNATVSAGAEFEPPLLSGSKAHQYLGLGTLGLAVLTGMTAPEECESAACASQPREMDGTHAKLAYATTAFAVATVATGLIYHWDDFSAEDGFWDPDNLHVILGVAGATLLAAAVQASASKSTGEVSHAGQAMAGAAGMAIAIKLTW